MHRRGLLPGQRLRLVLLPGSGVCSVGANCRTVDGRGVFLATPTREILRVAQNEQGRDWALLIATDQARVRTVCLIGMKQRAQPFWLGASLFVRAESCRLLPRFSGRNPVGRRQKRSICEACSPEVIRRGWLKSSISTPRTRRPTTLLSRSTISRMFPSRTSTENIWSKMKFPTE